MSPVQVPEVTDGFQKSVAAAIVAVASLVGYFVALDPNTTESIVAVVAAILNVGAVYQTRNKPAGE